MSNDDGEPHGDKGEADDKPSLVAYTGSWTEDARVTDTFADTPSSDAETQPQDQHHGQQDHSHDGHEHDVVAGQVSDAVDSMHKLDGSFEDQDNGSEGTIGEEALLEKHQRASETLLITAKVIRAQALEVGIQPDQKQEAKSGAQEPLKAMDSTVEVVCLRQTLTILEARRPNGGLM